MHTRNSIIIHAPTDRIFSLAADIEDWPNLLEHYRSVAILESSQKGCRKVADMAAVRDDFPVRGVSFPVRWRSVQICEPDAPRISFKHVRGVAFGMWVVWTFEEHPEGGIRVAIDHHLRYPCDCLNGWFAQEIVGKLFVEEIAGKTLRAIARIAEAR